MSSVSEAPSVFRGVSKSLSYSSTSIASSVNKEKSNGSHYSRKSEYAQTLKWTDQISRKIHKATAVTGGRSVTRANQSMREQHNGPIRFRQKYMKPLSRARKPVTGSKSVTRANQSMRERQNGPIRFPNKHMKRVPSHDWFWFRLA